MRSPWSTRELEPLDLLLELQAIEYAYYRRRDEESRWGPRTLDLDIILFGNRRINDSHLVSPSPRIPEPAIRARTDAGNRWRSLCSGARQPQFPGRAGASRMTLQKLEPAHG